MIYLIIFLEAFCLIALLITWLTTRDPGYKKPELDAEADAILDDYYRLEIG